jgi:hypothetical protein
MPACRVSVERLIAAPAEVVYHCLADYRAHHRVDGGFLPPAFTDLQVLEGGVGAGTVIQFWTKIGGRTAARVQTVTEPEPGRVLRESGQDSGAGEGSTFTVEPHGPRLSLVRIETVIRAGGLTGLLLPVIGPRMLRPIIADELARLERYAQGHQAAGLPSEHNNDHGHMPASILA